MTKVRQGFYIVCGVGDDGFMFKKVDGYVYSVIAWDKVIKFGVHLVATNEWKINELSTGVCCDATDTLEEAEAIIYDPQFIRRMYLRLEESDCKKTQCSLEGWKAKERRLNEKSQSLLLHRIQRGKRGKK